MKTLHGTFSKTLETVKVGDIVDLGLSRYSLGICTYVDGEENKRDCVIFENVKKDGTKGRLSSSFFKSNNGWYSFHPYTEWKRG
jgi:hypothetical protein